MADSTLQSESVSANRRQLNLHSAGIDFEDLSGQIGGAAALAGLLATSDELDRPEREAINGLGALLRSIEKAAGGLCDRYIAAGKLND